MNNKKKVQILDYGQTTSEVIVSHVIVSHVLSPAVKNECLITGWSLELRDN